MDLELLLRAYRNGEDGAKARLVAALLPQLRHYFLSRDFAHSTANDLAHDTIVIALEHVPKLKDQSSMRAWVFTVARNLGHDHHRMMARRLETSLGRMKDMAADPRGLSSEFRQAWQVNDVKAGVEKLPPMEREVIRCDLDEGDLKALARRMGLTEPALRGLRRRAILRLKTMFWG